MEKTTIVFVVLIYRNYKDLIDFINSLKTLGVVAYKVIIVDAFYDETTSKKIKEISGQYQCDYVQIENKGYSYGNNKGISFATDKYVFDYIAISNPDIEIKTMDLDSLKKYPSGCYGPEISTRDKTNQNPMYIDANITSRKLVYKGLKTNNTILFNAGIVLNKVMNWFSRRKLQSNRAVYQLHGSFMIFPYEIIKTLLPVFDEKMFLFAEETYLAKKLQNNGITSYYVPEIKVFHKEDGSMKFIKDINKPLRDSNIYVYEKYYGFRLGKW